MPPFDHMTWLVLPFLIFCARLLDVSMATLRHILVYRGMRKLAPIIGFFEVLIWLVAITQVMQRMTHVAGYLAWGLGFAAGTYLGMWIDDRLAMGHQLVRIITHKNSEELRHALKEHNYGVTMMNARGSQGDVAYLFVVTERGRLQKLVEVIQTIDPTLFYTIEDVRTVRCGIFSPPATRTITEKKK